MLTEMLGYFGIAIAAALAIIVLAKFVLQNVIRKPADYYESREAEEEAAIIAAFEAGKSKEH